jgi:hypothetical protein
VPLTVLLAWPMAHLLGLMPQRRPHLVTSEAESARPSVPDLEEALAPVAAR